MTDEKFQKAIDRILNGQTAPQTREEAMQNLIACGILTEDGSIAERYKDIFVIKNDNLYWK